MGSPERSASVLSNDCLDVDIETMFRLLCLTTLLPAVIFGVLGPFLENLQQHHALCVATRNAFAVQTIYYVIYAVIMITNSVVMRPIQNKQSKVYQQTKNYIYWMDQLSEAMIAIHLVLFYHDRANFIGSINCGAVTRVETLEFQFVILAVVRQTSLAAWFAANLTINSTVRSQYAMTQVEALRRRGVIGKLYWWWRDWWGYAAAIYVVASVSLPFLATLHVFGDTGALWRTLLDGVNLLAFIGIQYYHREYSNDQKSSYLTSGHNRQIILKRI